MLEFLSLLLIFKWGEFHQRFIFAKKSVWEKEWRMTELYFLFKNLLP